ncbi:MAG: hypothetical protein D6820_01140 [Lentisphaerae bacterium]|nr:MAG: hypothetical protein D6820_01140 [Lentisphaerota bacterium]
MLEGQVAALHSQVLDGEHLLKTLTALRESSLYVPDRNTYLLYPDRQIAPVWERNKIPESKIASCSVIHELLKFEDNPIVRRDETGVVRFHADAANAMELKEQLRTYLDRIGLQFSEDSMRTLEDLFEEVFNHHEFTGRSTTFFAYEGLNSVYWHMVSKLLLALQENIFRLGLKEKQLDDLRRYYFAIRHGLGYSQGSERFGAFACDPYSHSPENAPARQPGMTGQAKEDILIRLGELGLRPDGGALRICPILLRSEDFNASEHTLEWAPNPGPACYKLTFPADSLAFLYLGQPFVYYLSTQADPEQSEITVKADHHDILYRGKGELSPEITRRLAQRDSGLLQVEVSLHPSCLCSGEAAY